MSKNLWKILLASPAFLGMGVASSAIAAEAPSVESLEVSQESVELAQITSVDELTDVLPTDWAYTALQNLVETYGCIEGYPNRTFRGNQPMTRYEFAAGLNACLDAIVAFLGTDGGVPESDLATIRRLQEEFAAELATLRGRVDALEAEVAELREQQFSTTTKLRGEAVATLVAPFDTLEDGAGDDFDNFVTFQTRARLNFDTSFTGDDRLRIRLQTSDNDVSLQAAGGLDDVDDQDFDFVINDFYYSFPIGSRIDAEIAANSRQADDLVTDTIVPWDGTAVADPSEPDLYEGPGVGGGGFAGALSFALTDNIIIDVGYSADEDDSANANGGGITGSSDQSYIGQLNFLTDGFFDGALTYVHGTEGGIETDNFGGLVSLDFGALIVAGYFAFHEYDGAAVDDDTSWQIGVIFPDLFVEGSELGVYYADRAGDGIDLSTDAYIVEGYYDLPVNQYLTITPAIVYGDLDGQLEGNALNSDDSFYGVIRATFNF